MSKVVVITGASSGIGRATTRRFAEPGISLALVARDREGLEAAAEEGRAAGAQTLVLPADVADPDAVEAAAQAVEEALGPIDTRVNVAMTTVFAFFEDVAHGPYDDRAHGRSVQLWATKHRRGLLGGLAGTVLAAAGAAYAR
jgi:NADP-dependent 3-hydroxy acid dehydrogenase YdfG